MSDSPPHPLDTHSPPPSSQPEVPEVLPPDPPRMTAATAKRLLASMKGPEAQQPPAGSRHKPKRKSLTHPKEAGTWVPMRGSKTSKPAQCWRWVRYDTDVRWKIHQFLLKTLKRRVHRNPNAPHAPTRSWARLLENLPVHEHTLTKLRSLCGDTPPASIPLVHIGSQTLNLAQLLTLQRKGWIHSAVIQAWSDLLATHSHAVSSAEVSKHHRVWIRDSFFYDRLTGVQRDPATGNVTNTSGLSLDAVARDTRRSDISGLQKILIPININNNHWILASIDTRAATITIFDSLHQPNLEIYYHLTAWLQALFPQTLTWSQASGRCEKQSGPDCGVHTMMNTLSGALNIQTNGVVSPPPKPSRTVCAPWSPILS